MTVSKGAPPEASLSQLATHSPSGANSAQLSTGLSSGTGRFSLSVLVSHLWVVFYLFRFTILKILPSSFLSGLINVIDTACREQGTRRQ